MGNQCICDAGSSETETEITDKDKKESNVPVKSKIAINTAYLLTRIIRDFFESEANRCEFMNENERTNLLDGILKNILILGGAARDILLYAPINDLDINCNTRELTKLHLLHLEKYHATKEGQNQNQCCVLWNHYLNKFEPKCKEYDRKIFANLQNSEECKSNKDIMSSSKYIPKCDYVLNCKFICNMLKTSEILTNKLSIKQWDCGYLLVNCMQIIDEVIFNKTNLDGQDLDIADIPERVLKEYMRNEEENKLFHQNSRDILAANKEKTIFESDSFFRSSVTSIRMRTTDLTLNANNDLIDLHLPIYRVSPDVLYKSPDLSINGLTLSLFAIKDVIQNGSSTVIDDFAVNVDIYKALQSRVGSNCKEHNFNPMKDIKSKVLNCTYAGAKHDPCEIFWRIIKFAIRYYEDGWKIHPKLIVWEKEIYSDWISNEDHMKVERHQELICEGQFTNGIAKTVDDYEKMMLIFHVLDFHIALQSALNSYPLFREKWLTILCEKDLGIINIFKQFHYPADV